MVAVVIVVTVVLLVLVAIVVALVLRRRGGDEVHSVEGYRHTLDTLQGIRTRTGSTSVRIIGGSGATGADDEMPAGPPGVIGGEHVGRALGEGPLVFEDHALSGSARHDRSNDRAIASMNHRPRRLGALVLAALVAVVVVVVLFLAGHHHPPAKATTATTVGHPSGTSATTGASATTVPRTRHHRVATTTTTAPTSFSAQSTTSTSATYVPPTPSYELTFTAAHGACWVLVTSASTGSTLYTAVMPQGTTQSVPASDQTKVQLGAPGAIAITLDGEPVILPTSLSSPYALYFQPATATVTTPTTAPVRGVAP
jgi:hypothetical protein